MISISWGVILRGKTCNHCDFLVHYSICLVLLQEHKQNAKAQGYSLCGWIIKSSFFLFFLKFILERGKGREEEEERNIHWEKHQRAWETSISCLPQSPKQGPGPQPKHLPWLGIEPAASPVRADNEILIRFKILYL